MPLTKPGNSARKVNGELTREPGGQRCTPQYRQRAARIDGAPRSCEPEPQRYAKTWS